MLSVEDRVFAPIESQFTPEFVDRLRPASRYIACEAVYDVSNLRNNKLCPCECRIRGQDRRIVGGEEGEWGQNVGGPRNARLLGDDGSGISEFSSQEQVGSAISFHSSEKIIVTLTQRGKEELAQSVLGSLFLVVDQGDEALVALVLVGADGKK